MANGTVGVAPSTTTITLPDGSTIALADWIDDRLFGSVQLGTGQATSVEAFSTGRSQQIPGGTRTQTQVDTNIPRAGQNGLPKDWEMLLYGIAIKPVRAMRAPTATPTAPILADTGGALSNVLQTNTFFQVDRMMFFEYQYNGKQYSQGTLADYPQGNGYSVFTSNTSFEIAQNGIPSPRDRLAVVLPIHMLENLSYTGVMNPQASLVIDQVASDGGTHLTFMDVKVTLNGLIKRTVV